MLSKIYRELMILGFISLSLVLSLEFSAPWVQNHHYCTRTLATDVSSCA
jgi:hypothetical protein